MIIGLKRGYIFHFTLFLSSLGENIVNGPVCAENHILVCISDKADILAIKSLLWQFFPKKAITFFSGEAEDER